MTVRPSDATRIPAGRYWVGDPCYANEDHDVWMEQHDKFPWQGGGLPEGKECNVVWAESNGDWYASAFTAYGDGVYEDEQGRSYPVDSGQIGVVPEECSESDKPFGMHLVEFETPFAITYLNGTITIGDIEIKTGDDQPGGWMLL